MSVAAAARYLSSPVASQALTETPGPFGTQGTPVRPPSPPVPPVEPHFTRMRHILQAIQCRSDGYPRAGLDRFGDKQEVNDCLDFLRKTKLVSVAVHVTGGKETVLWFPGTWWEDDK